MFSIRNLLATILIVIWSKYNVHNTNVHCINRHKTNRFTCVTGSRQAGQQITQCSKQVPKSVQWLLTLRLHIFSERQTSSFQRYLEDFKKILNYSIENWWCPLVLPAQRDMWGANSDLVFMNKLPQQNVPVMYIFSANVMRDVQIRI